MAEELKEIKVKKMYTKFTLSDGDNTIFAKISEGRITFKNKNGGNNFNFIMSNRRTVEGILRLMVEALEIKE